MADFPRASEFKVAIDCEFLQDFAEAAENVAESRQIARSRFREDDAAGPAARARVDAGTFKHNDGFFGSEQPQPRRRSQSRESAPDYGEIN